VKQGIVPPQDGAEENKRQRTIKWVVSQKREKKKWLHPSLPFRIYIIHSLDHFPSLERGDLEK
jgi:hypothetical protein